MLLSSSSSTTRGALRRQSGLAAHAQAGRAREASWLRHQAWDVALPSSSSSSISSRQMLPLRHTHSSEARKSSAQADRYLVIHAFFTRAASEHQRARVGSYAGHTRPKKLSELSLLPSHARFASSSAPRRRHSHPDEDDSLRELRALQSGGNEEKWRDEARPPGRSRNDETTPFHNYPRTLRELAIQARQNRNPRHTDDHHHRLDTATPDTDEEISRLVAALRDSADRPTNAGHTEASSSQIKDGPEQKDAQGGEPAAAKSSWTRPRPPSKEDLLKIAQGFWTRMRIRFKWFTIRGFRRFNADDISAFFTLGGLGTAIFVIVGTTTFVSLVFAALDALNMQEWIARKLADHLTSETGVTVIFESAIVPKWRDSRICFQNVFLSRRAYGNDTETLRSERRDTHNKRNRRKRMTAHTAGQGMAWEGTHFSEYDDEEVAPPMSDVARGQDIGEDDDDGRQTNFTMFDLNVDSIDVKLSFRRWWDGKGLVEDAVVEGVRGIIDRRNVFWDPDRPYDPRAARRKPNHGDFELSLLSLKDFLVSVYQPGDFRPFNLSIFEAQVPRLRKQWLFYDLLGADRITGQVDGCLMSLHKPQSIGRTTGREREIMDGRWKTLSRLRIDGVNFDHIQNQSDVHGPVSWVVSGKFDVVADIKLPKDTSGDIDINVIIGEIFDHLSAAVAGDGKDGSSEAFIPGQHRLSGPAIEAPVTTVGPAAEGAWRLREYELEKLKKTPEGGQRGWRSEMEAAGREASRSQHRGSDPAVSRTDGAQSMSHHGSVERGDVPLHPEEDDSPDPHSSNHEPKKSLITSTPSVVIDLDVRFKDIKAAVPLFSSDLNYRTQTYVRPIVAFMNANHTLIPVHCRVMMDLSEFDGAQDLAQTGLLPIISEKIYEALANHVQSQRANNQRIRSVSQWWLRLATDRALQYAVLIRDTLARNGAGGSTATGDPASLSLSQGPVVGAHDSRE